MTLDDIIRMAREAGLVLLESEALDYSINSSADVDAVARFAELVAAMKNVSSGEGEK